MSTMSASEIISVLKSEIEDFDRKSGVQETGTVVQVGDGIATVYGIQHAMYGELVEFENGVRGIVQNLETKTISVVLLGSDYGIIEGTKVVRTKKRAGIGISPKMIGRVVDALGSPIDSGGSIEAEDFFPIEREAPGIANRKSVSVPLQTGILSIDSMFPIGRGQRELIIGDRQTGKTSIAVDTIINQKGQDVICIYVAIGQKSSTVAKIVSTLKKMDAMDYTIVVSASASEPVPVQYISPYSGTAIAEYFMMQGKDVLIVYDDLSKHAVAYRAMSLLLHRPPGREAYPGDVFYLHSRLLERSCRLDDAHGGGSITALPIIETQAGDVSAYIPTNVISITDGQIFLESELFNAGMRPAVNVGLSVSRVGSAAQTKAMKKASGQMRIELAQFREMEVFTQFSSDLDPATRAILDHGHILMELLKQPLYHPLAMWKEVVLLVAVLKKLMDDVEPSELNDFRAQMLHYVSQNGADLVQGIQKTGMMSDETMEALIALIIKYKKQVN
ncbi:MAG: F0F1 ATP synthase subunit alpha [Ruminococcus sp.]|nr:F0F1 ATP synthase subunit alpha [Ruminococcus sp.]